MIFRHQSVCQKNFAATPFLISGWILFRRVLILKQIEKKNNATIIEISSIPFSIPFTDDASIENCLHCIIALKTLGVDDSIIQSKILSLRNLPMRLELKYGINNCTIIDDSYSADFHSLQIALDFFKQQEKQP